MSTRMMLAFAKQFEREIAADLTGRRVFLSGAGFEKADVRKRSQFVGRGTHVERSPTLAFRIEAKTTGNNRYNFHAQDWRDLIHVADAAGEMPILAVKFLGFEVAIALVRSGFALELGFVLPAMPAREMKRSLTLYPNRGLLEQIAIPRSTGKLDVTAVVPYPVLIESVKQHADFTKREEGATFAPNS